MHVLRYFNYYFRNCGNRKIPTKTLTNSNDFAKSLHRERVQNNKYVKMPVTRLGRFGKDHWKVRRIIFTIFPQWTHKNLHIIIIIHYTCMRRLINLSLHRHRNNGDMHWTTCNESVFDKLYLCITCQCCGKRNRIYIDIKQQTYLRRFNNRRNE